MTFHVDRDLVVEYDPVRYTRLRLGRVARSSRAWAFGVRNDDEIVRVDGAEFAEPDPIDFIWSRLRAGERVVVTIRRGTDEFPFELDHSLLRDVRAQPTAAKCRP